MSVEAMREDARKTMAEEKRKHLLARIAGNIAAGMITAPSPPPFGVGTFTVESPPPAEVARYAVDVARAILEEIGL